MTSRFSPSLVLLWLWVGALMLPIPAAASTTSEHFPYVVGVEGKNDGVLKLLVDEVGRTEFRLVRDGSDEPPPTETPVPPAKAEAANAAASAPPVVPTVTPTPSEAPIYLRLSKFQAEHRIASARLEVDKKQPPQGRVPGSGPPVSVSLVAAELIEDVLYKGTLSVSQGGKVQHWQLQLLKPSRQSGSLRATAPMPLVHCTVGVRHAACEFDVTLSNTSRTDAVYGVIVELEEVTVPLDQSNPSGCLTIKARTTEGEEATIWPATSRSSSKSLSVARRGNAVATATIANVTPGEHKYRLRFRGADEVDSEQQVVTVTIKAKHAWWPALLCLVSASLMFWLLTTGIGHWREKQRLKDKLSRLRSFGANAELTFPEVWLRAERRLTQELLDMTCLRAPASISRRIECLNQVGALLDRQGELRTRLKRAAAKEHLARYRAQKHLTSTIDQMTARVLAETDPQQLAQKLEPIRAELDRVQLWVDKPDVCYRDVIKGHKQRLKWEINLDAVKVRADALKKLSEWKQDIEQTRDDADFDKLAEADEKFVKIQLCWDRRSEKRLKELEAVADDLDKPLRDIFDTANQACWERVKGSKAEIKSMHSAPETLRPLTYCVRFSGDDAELNDRFFVRKRMSVTWEFTHGGVSRKETRLGTTVAWFARQKGKLTVKTTLSFGSDEGESSPSELEENVAPAREYALRRVIQRTEFVGLVGATLLAAISGLASLYYKDQTFGSLVDYLGLILWSGGVEQGKNLFAIIEAGARKDKAQNLG